MKLLIILLLIKLIFPELKLTFESDEIKLTQENKKDFELLVKNEIYTKFNIGNPNQEIKCYIQSLIYDFYILNKNKEGFYSKNKSKSYFSTSKEKYYFHDSNYKEGFYSYEKFNFNNLKNENFIISNFSILIVENSNLNYPCFLGLSLRDISNDYHRNFFQSLIAGKKIKEINYSIEYLNENKGEIIIGKLPHEYNKKYKEENLKFIQINSDYYSSYWNIKFNKIEFENQKFSGSHFPLFKYENNMIFCPKEYKEIFLKNVFNKNKCFEFITVNDYYYYKCNENSDFSYFPKIKFYSFDLNYTFILDKNDLIKKINDKYYILIYFSDYEQFIWKLGKPFLQKYKFIFLQDKKIIGFYNNNIINKDESSFFYYFFIFLCFFIIIVLNYVLYKIYRNKRKKRNNEIEEIYEYFPNNKI